MGRIRNAVLGFVADLMAEIRYDPIGAMSVDEAVALLSKGDPALVTVAQVERISAAAQSMGQLGQQQSASGLPPESQVPDGWERVDDPEKVAELAKQYGVDPSQVVAYQPPKTRTVKTVNGEIPASEVPLGPDGKPDEKWVAENCACEKCEAKRKAKREQRLSREGTGGYV